MKQLNISLISDDKVSDNKAGCLSYVDGVFTLESLAELAVVSMQYHIAIGTFHNNKRDGEHFLRADLLAFDFDDGTLASEVHRQCYSKGWRHIIMASKNHLIDKNDGNGVRERFHLFLLHRTENKEDYKYASKKISYLNNWNNDKACSDCTRYFYKHAKCLYNWDYGIEIAGDYINRFKELEQMFQKQDKKPVLEKGMDIFKTTKAFEKLRSNLSADGNRYAESSHILGVMLKCDLSESECLSLFDQFATYGRGFTRESVSRRYNQWR